MNTNQWHLLLADDDEDDCLFFKEALNRLPIDTDLTTVHDGDQLMQLLTKSKNPLPDALFLDLNMPRKSGYDCLAELKLNPKPKPIPVIILSTFFEQEVADQLFLSGAKDCLQKPTDFAQLKQLIQQSLASIDQNPSKQSISEPVLLMSNDLMTPR